MSTLLSPITAPLSLYRLCFSANDFVCSKVNYLQKPQEQDHAPFASSNSANMSEVQVLAKQMNECSAVTVQQEEPLLLHLPTCMVSSQRTHEWKQERLPSL